MIILVGPSASGKTELGKLLELRGIPKLVTYTTRNIRINELDGKDYHFVSHDTFKELIKQDFFYEYTLYNNNYYGTPKKDVNCNCYVILEPKGLLQYKDNENCISFYINAPNTILFNRMINRGDSVNNATERISVDAHTFTREVQEMCDYVLDGTESLEALVEEILGILNGLH